MKRLYSEQREALVRCLKEIDGDLVKADTAAGMAVVVTLPGSVSDVDIASRARRSGLSPVPLSPWYKQAPAQQGLLLGVTNLNERTLAKDCQCLVQVVREGG
jgi:GntR family transcriptional regulator/MocR family aminotransferase